jgi:hypothetical protein
MKVDVGTVGALLIGAVLLWRGLEVRLGRWRGYREWYENPNLPAVLRNGAFGLLPMGLGLASFGAVGLVGAGTPAFGLRMFVLLLAVDAFILIAARPPKLFKPRWVLEIEGPTNAVAPLQGLDKGVLALVGAANLALGLLVVITVLA